MVESTRIADVDNSTIEIHLKKNEEIRSDIVAQVAGLPTGDEFVVLRRDSSTDSWSNASTFNDFVSADTEFVNRAQNEGISSAERSQLGKDDRVISG